MDDDLKNVSDSMAASSERASYTPSKPKSHKKRPRFLKWLLISLLVIIVLGAAGYGAWKFALNKPKAAPAPTQTATTTVAPKKVDDIPEAVASKDYASTALSVGFKYPVGWKVSEATGGIRVESPTFSYSDLQQGTTVGNFRIYIRQGAREIDGKYIGRGVAVKPSEKLTYTQPAIGQRTDTLLSSFGLDADDNFGFFMIAGNFQLQKGDTLGPSYGKEAETYIVAGGYSTPGAVDDLATTPVSLDYYSTTNAYKQGLAIIASLKLQ